MAEKSISTLILEESYSKREALRKVRTLKTILNTHFFKGKSISDTFKEYTPEEINFFKDQKVSFWKEFNQNFSEKLSQVEKEIENFPTLTLYVALELSNKEVEQLGHYVRKNFGKDILVDIKLEPNLIGGSALVWNGVYKDYSLKARLETKRKGILEEFAKYS